MEKYKYEVRQIDALEEDEGAWTWNTSYNLGTMETAADDVGRALRRYLKAKVGVSFVRGKTRTEGYDVVEIVERKSGMPLFAAVPMF